MLHYYDMKTTEGKARGMLILIAAIIIIGGVAWYGRNSSGTNSDNSGNTPIDNVSASETTKISNSLSEYSNSELGFSVKYPNSWEKEDSNSGVNFIIPIDKSQVSTIATLQATVQARGGKCAFPPVTTGVQERGQITVGDKTVEMMSLSSNVQGRIYISRIYNLQQPDICYVFYFSSIALSPSSKGLTGSNITQAQNNNKALTTTADSDFTNMVKSFAIVSLPAGQDETQVKPGNK